MEIFKDIELVDLALLINKKVLVISDLHLGFEESLVRQGVLVPKSHWKDLMFLLSEVLKRTDPKTIVVNGDIKHDFGSISRQEWSDVSRLIDFLRLHCKEIIFVKGNHDTILKPIAEKKGLRVVKELVVDDALILHGDTIPTSVLKNVKTIIVGHAHPAVRLRQGVRNELFKCFLVGKWKKKEKIREEFLPLKNCFEKNHWAWKHSEDLENNIVVKTKGDMFLYNYGDNVLVERNHPVLVKCRGIVVKSDGAVLNFPFERFFNSFEKECAVIDWETAVVQEKVDGSLICVFWNGDSWEISTRGSFYPTESATVDFSDLFREHFNHFEKLKKEYCYMFELVTKKNRIVTYYPDERVYLVGARNLRDLKEVSRKDLDMISSDIGVLRPRLFDAKNMDECKKVFETLKKDDEGVVLVDAHFNRLKVKQESYLKLSKIRMLKEQELFEYVLGKITIDVEYLHAFPDIVEEIEKIRIVWINAMKEVQKTFDAIKNIPTRKDFALKAVRYPYKSILFLLLDGKDVSKAGIQFDDVKTWKKSSSGELAERNRDA